MEIVLQSRKVNSEKEDRNSFVLVCNGPPAEGQGKIIPLEINHTLEIVSPSPYTSLPHTHSPPVSERLGCIRHWQFTLKGNFNAMFYQGYSSNFF